MTVANRPRTAAPVRRVAIALVTVLALVLTACGGTEGEAGDDGAGGREGVAFQPVTIEHALGKAEITEQPTRVVTLGQGSTETAIALGVTPVGIEEYPWGSDETGYLPWVYAAVKERGQELPVQFTGATELNVEAIAGLDPDVILAPWSGVTQEQYDQLKEIAPTVAYAKEPWVITWQEQIRVIAKALGKGEEGEGLIADLDHRLANSARPEYAGLTFSYLYNDGEGNIGVFFKDEQRVAVVRALGLTVDPVVETLREYEVPGTDSALLSLELADRFAKSDLIFTFYSDAQNRREMEAQPLYQAIPAIKRGSVVAPTYQPLVTAASIINPLTVPWALEQFTPLIDEAVARLER